MKNMIAAKMIGPATGWSATRSMSCVERWPPGSPLTAARAIARARRWTATKSRVVWRNFFSP
jgi:hypothetical protein